jgi:ribokinase
MAEVVSPVSASIADGSGERKATHARTPSSKDRGAHGLPLGKRSAVAITLSPFVTSSTRGFLSCAGVEPLRFAAVGDLLVDVSVRGGKGHDARISLRAGGSAANAAVWAAQLGARTTLIGRVGDDLAGQALAAALEDRGIDLQVSVDEEAATGTFVLLHGQRFVDRGANGFLAPEHLPGTIEADVVAVSPYLQPATASAAVDRARSRWTAALGKPLLGANAVVLSELETDEGVHTLAERFRLACVTLGELGAIAVLDGEEASASAPAAQAAEATGAGDAFAAALLVELARGAPLRDALDAACRCGAEAAVSPAGWPVVK